MIISIQPPELKFLKELANSLKCYKQVKLRTLKNGFKIYFKNKENKGKIVIKNFIFLEYTENTMTIAINKNIPCYLNPEKLYKTITEVYKDEKYKKYMNGRVEVKNHWGLGSNPKSKLMDWQMAEFYIKLNLKNNKYKIINKCLERNAVRDDINTAL